MIDRLLSDPRVLMLGGAIVGGLALAMMLKPRAVAESAGRLAVGLAEGTATGVVVGIGTAVGVPETNRDQCASDLAAGRTWDASFSCPAKQFLTSFFD
jgi:hypothetical protein